MKKIMLEVEVPDDFQALEIANITIELWRKNSPGFLPSILSKSLVTLDRKGYARVSIEALEQIEAGLSNFLFDLTSNAAMKLNTQLAQVRSMIASARQLTPEALVRAEPVAINTLLTDVCLILDVVKAEWEKYNSWSDWDQSVRDRAFQYLKAFYAAPHTDAAPLSDARIEEIAESLTNDLGNYTGSDWAISQDDIIKFARAIEQAHGIALC